MQMTNDSFIAVFLFSFGMAIGAVLSPGPVTTAIISQTPRLGWVTGPLVSIGHALLIDHIKQTCLTEREREISGTSS